jgi:Plasmid pRiA4b ORF-3-like protein
LPDEPADAERPSAGPALQLKVRLLQVGPMIRRRLLVPAAMTLRELHGVVQVATGWEGIHLFRFHLRAVRYGSPELSASSPDVALETLRLRPGSRFVHEYDLTAPWRHEVRVERHTEPGAGKPGPFRLDGHGDRPAEDSGGPAGHLAHRRDAAGLDATNDPDTVAKVLEQVLRTRTTAVLDDSDTRRELEAALERMRERESFLPVPFSRREVNARLRRGEHRSLTHRQA